MTPLRATAFRFAFVPAFACLVAASPAHAADAAATTPAASAAATTTPPPLRYTFSWPIDSASPKPRGGITRGPPVTLDSAPSPAWQALQAPGLSPAERDRRAILAMAGTYRVTFDFLEIARYGASGPALAPYQSWATEKVYVDRDEPGFVSLVHILEMRIVDASGTVSDPFVTKHWRQDWRWQPATLLEYAGRDRWRLRTVGAAEARGAWSQTVHQVDESPRYASLGRWQHNASFSTWLSGDTWRPLPRREWSVRSDYQLLVGSNRHTVGPAGWAQEENNLKAVLDGAGAIDAARPYVGREVGMARYERLAAGAVGTDFAAADRYYEKTRPFWNRVVDVWSAEFARGRGAALRGPVDKLGLYQPLFERAEKVEDGSADAADAARGVDAVVRSMLAPG